MTARKCNPIASSSSADILRRGAENILESISDGVFTVDLNWKITFFNHAAELITGVSRGDALGRPCQDVFRASMCETGCALRHTFESGHPLVNRSAFIVNADGRRIPVTVSTALLRDEAGRIIGGAETFRDLSLVEELRSELEGRVRIGDLVSRSVSMRRLFEILPRIAASDATVLIHGETGTGKELVARAVHQLSPRRDKPFVAVNCAALPDALLESELFGYVRGAFTGADRDKPGRFDLAAGGTLFLDEIGDISPALQVRLLRVLQEREFEPLGSNRPRQADVRVEAATHHDLKKRIADGTFREDLYYRLNVVALDLPPLRDRKEDVPLLAETFIARLNRRENKQVSGMAPEVLTLLMTHDYPGNVRELENIIERAFVMCAGGRIEVSHLPPELVGRRPASVGHGPNELACSRRLAEAAAIREALSRHGNNRSNAAQALGLHKSSLYRKIRALGIELPREDGRSRGRKSG